MHMAGKCAFPESRHRDERNLFVQLIAPNTLRPRVERGLAVHEKQVMVMPMVQLDLRAPSSVMALFHRMRRGVPIVEIPGNEHFSRIRSVAVKVNRLQVSFGGVTVLTAT
jgi:hypothetical protein